GDVDVVDSDARAADRPQVRRLRQQVRVDLRGRADQQAVVLADALLQLLPGPVGPDVDGEAVSAQQLDPRVADLLLHQDLHRASCSTTKSMHPVSARTSSGSTAGNMPMRSWLRPSLR